ncbi:MotA/TolQ/ExbB proton channel family protein [Halopseudomonas maritima]|uniref:MotA/TolQ/ExbB proton channel family protein n=1 Tax=Halopseudomonas maritima TaxID=2918528 RepID=UPI001EE9E5B2|nr:MotA/TolQ/ExbB proton channel family protein [Halopseudomonas maritima]UJJ31649.1 MotA/TolQ/ExbB proton channel family protein [Halopseudomonas maritima]
MQNRSYSLNATRWQQRLRALSLLVLLGAGGTSAGLVLAQAETNASQTAVTETTVATEASTAAAVSAAPVAAPAPVVAEHTSFGVKEMYLQADPLVKSVMILLVFCSLLTWAVLLEKIFVFGRARRRNTRFLKAFRAGQPEQLGDQLEHSAMGRMWQVAQGELRHFRSLSVEKDEPDRINRLLQRIALTAGIVQERDLARMGSMMGVLATIGATAPFIGLFGTVWGILNSFASIATLKSASLAVVAPGIAEALLATALGLFAAIPAVMIFNKFARDINGFVGALDNFSAEMIASVSRQLDEGR